MKLKYSRVYPNLKNIIEKIESCYYYNTNGDSDFYAVVLNNVKKGVLLCLNVFNQLKDLIKERDSQKFHLRFYNENDSFFNFLQECLKYYFSNGCYNKADNIFIEFEICTTPYNDKICIFINTNFKVRTDITLEDAIIEVLDIC